MGVGSGKVNAGAPPPTGREARGRRRARVAGAVARAMQPTALSSYFCSDAWMRRSPICGQEAWTQSPGFTGETPSGVPVKK